MTKINPQVQKKAKMEIIVLIFLTKYGKDNN